MINTNSTDNYSIREDIANFGLEQIDKIYVHGKHGPEFFDCAGFVWYVYYNILGIDIYDDGYGLSTTTKIMTSKYGKITLFNENSLTKDFSLINKGDILLFHRQSLDDFMPRENNKYPGHCGIYLDNNIFIHCSRPKGRVILNSFKNSKYWRKVLIGSIDIANEEIIYKKNRP